MIIKIYSKDDAAPDTLDALQWLQERFDVELIALLSYKDEIIKYYLTDDKAQCFLINYSCGIYEDVYEIPTIELTDSLIDSIRELDSYIWE